MPITINRKSLANGGTINGSVTINGNLTAAGTGTHLFSGSLGLTYAGTQKWHLTATTGGDLYFTRTGIADRMTLSSDGALAGMASVAVAATSAIKGVRTATATVAIGTVAVDAYGYADLTLTGAALNDTVTVNRTDGVNTTGLSAFVSATNTVRVILRNDVGFVYNYGDIPVRVTVISF